MAYIRTIQPDEATGSLRKQYDEAERRAGRVYEIVKLSSLNPSVNRTFMSLYIALMKGPSGLSTVEREAIATAVSRANSCHY